MSRTINNIMRLVKKEFTVFEIDELNPEAKAKAIDWVLQDDFYNMSACEYATEAAEEAVLEFFKELVIKYDDARTRGYQMLVDYNHAKPEIEWDTCSAGFVRELKINLPVHWDFRRTTEINEMLSDYDLNDDTAKLHQEVADKINESLSWSFDEAVLEDYILGSEFEFTKYGKFYRD